MSDVGLDFRYGGRASTRVTKPRATYQPRARRRHGVISIQGHTLDYPCGHAKVWPATDLPSRDPGTYVFDCERCSTRHYLFVHERAVAGHIPVEWDTVSEAIRLATPAEAVKGRRLRDAEPEQPRHDSVVVSLDVAGRAHPVQARSHGGSSAAAMQVARRDDAMGAEARGLRVQRATRSA